MAVTARLYTLVASEIRPLVDAAEYRIVTAVTNEASRQGLAERRVLKSVVIRLADAFKTRNPRFSRERFYVACGFDADIQ